MSKSTSDIVDWPRPNPVLFCVGDVVDIQYKTGGPTYTYVLVNEREWSKNPDSDFDLTDSKLRRQWNCNQVIVRKYQGEWLPVGLRPDDRSW